MEKNNEIPRFEIDIKEIKIAGSEKDISHTIEELLELNNKIPARWGEEPDGITEKQLVKGEHSDEGKHKGEETEITEGQLGKRKEPNYQVLEVEAESASPADLGHRPEAWDVSEVEMRGHKCIPPLWIEVYQQDDKKKKLDKGQLDKKIKR